MNIKLTIELVPKTAWFTHLRSELSTSQWNLIRRTTYRKSNYRCEICNGVGPRWPVECHEIWHYDDNNYIQKLVGTIALCPDCHMVKHIGFAQIRGLLSNAIVHLQKTNKWNLSTAESYIKSAFNVWNKRSNHIWKMDTVWLKENFDIDLDIRG